MREYDSSTLQTSLEACMIDFLEANDLELVVIDSEEFKGLREPNQMIKIPYFEWDHDSDSFLGVGTCNPQLMSTDVESDVFHRMEFEWIFAFFLVRREMRGGVHVNKTKVPVVTIVARPDDANDSWYIELVCSLSKDAYDQTLPTVPYLDGFEELHGLVDQGAFDRGYDLSNTEEERKHKKTSYDVGVHKPMFPQATARLFRCILEEFLELGGQTITIMGIGTAQRFYRSFGFTLDKPSDQKKFKYMTLTRHSFETSKQQLQHRQRQQQQTNSNSTRMRGGQARSTGTGTGAKGKTRYQRTQVYVQVAGVGRRELYLSGKSMYVRQDGRYRKLQRSLTAGAGSVTAA